MKAPDKIYLPEEPDVFFQVEYDKDMYPVEYIRKDFLLEWVKSELESITGNFGLAEGGKIVLDMLINKLNSM